jgi:hypothetical protein
LKDLIIREQFLKVCLIELCLFLKERKPKDRRDVISLAEQYLKAHGGTITNSKSSKAVIISNKSPICLNQGNITKPVQHLGAAELSYGEQNENYCKTNRDSSQRNLRNSPGENKHDGRSDETNVSRLCMTIFASSSYGGCIEEGKLKLKGNSVPAFTSS